MMKNLTNSQGVKYAIQCIEFKNKGDSLKGKNVYDYNSMVNYSWLDKDSKVLLFTFFNDMEFVVFSYNTPIAWKLKNSDWVINSKNYSRTTIQHKSKLKNELMKNKYVSQGKTDLIEIFSIQQ